MRRIYWLKNGLCLGPFPILPGEPRARATQMPTQRTRQHPMCAIGKRFYSDVRSGQVAQHAVAGLEQMMAHECST